MAKLPPLDPNTKEVLSPHIFILGAGASKAAFPSGDRNGHKLPVMADIIENLEINSLCEEFGGRFPSKNFEEYYSLLVESGEHIDLVKAIEEHLWNYFSELRLPDEPTLYDYLILFLRSKDVIATFNWDPLLFLAYQRNSNITELPQLLFLHGNVGVGVCIECRVKGMLGNKCSKCGKQFQKTKLLYPIRTKSYTNDEYIKSEWDGLLNYLKNAYWINIFGYSAPSTDLAAKELMSSVYSKNKYKELAQMEFVDIADEIVLRNNWKEFIVREHYGISKRLEDTYLFSYPRRTCEAFYSSSLMLKPWSVCSIPPINSVKELQEWITPLVEEETMLKKGNYSLKSDPF